MPAEVVDQGARDLPPRRRPRSGKPANIVAKMVEGRDRQVPGRGDAARPAVRQGRRQETVGELLKAKGATVNGFVLYVVGEGIEKKKDDFAAEVAAMAKA